MTITLNGSGTIGGITAGGLPDGTITDADIVSLNGAKLTGSIPAAQLTGSIPAAQMYAGLNATGSAPIYACRAWVNFNGKDTVAIRASGNVSSITDNGTGDYTVNFTTAMPDANYSAVTTAGFLNNGNTNSGSKVYSTSTSGVRVLGYAPVSSATDFDGFFVSVFR